MSRHATFLIAHSDPLKRHHAHWKLELKQSQNCDQCWRSCGFFPPFTTLGGRGGEGWVRRGRVTWEVVRPLSHGSCLQAELTGGGGVLLKSLCKRKLEVFFHVAPLNKLKSSLHQTACHGNPCHQSKGEFGVCSAMMLNVLFVQCLTKSGV